MSAQAALDSSAETSSSFKDSRFDDVLNTAISGSGGGGGSWSRMGEATGECAAVCCCCPCAMMHLFILAVFRLPAALWTKKKARRRRLLRKKMKCPPLEKANQQKLEVEVEVEEEASADGGDCTTPLSGIVRCGNFFMGVDSGGALLRGRRKK